MYPPNAVSPKPRKRCRSLSAPPMPLEDAPYSMKRMKSATVVLPLSLSPSSTLTPGANVRVKSFLPMKDSMQIFSILIVVPHSLTLRPSSAARPSRSAAAAVARSSGVPSDSIG